MNIKIDSYMMLCLLPMALEHRYQQQEVKQLYEVVSAAYDPGAEIPSARG